MLNSIIAETIKLKKKKIVFACIPFVFLIFLYFFVQTYSIVGIEKYSFSFFFDNTYPSFLITQMLVTAIIGMPFFLDEFRYGTIRQLITAPIIP